MNRKKQEMLEEMNILEIKGVTETNKEERGLNSMHQQYWRLQKKQQNKVSRGN